MARTELREIPNEDIPAPAYGTRARNGTKPARVPPHDVDAEAAMLGVILDSPRGVEVAAAAGLEPASFYKPDHGTIYAAVLAVAHRSDPVDPITVADELRRTHQLENVGGVPALIDLQTSMPWMGQAHAAKYARIVAQHALLRRVIGVAADIADLGYSYADDPHEVVERVRDLVEHAATSVVVDGDPWAPISLASVWDQPILERPHVLARADGVPLLYMGRINTVAGPPESGKSWLGYLACAQLAAAGVHCAYIDLEDRVEGAAARVRNLGVDMEVADAHIHYFAPDTDLAGAVTAMQRLGVPLDLIVVDSASEAIVAAGGEINSNDDGTRFGRALRRLAQVTGAAVFYIDHVKQDHEAGSGKSLGAGAKKRFLDGAAYETILIHRFGPGREGAANILNTKDRHGGVVANCEKRGKNDIAGRLIIDAHEDGVITNAAITPPSEIPTSVDRDTGAFRPTGYMERVSRWLELNPGQHSKNEVRDAVRGDNKYIDAALKALRGRYAEFVEGPNRVHLYTHREAYREGAETPSEDP